MGKSLFIFWVRRDGCDGSDCFFGRKIGKRRNIVLFDEAVVECEDVKLHFHAF